MNGKFFIHFVKWPLLGAFGMFLLIIAAYAFVLIFGDGWHEINANFFLSLTVLLGSFGITGMLLAFFINFGYEALRSRHERMKQKIENDKAIALVNEQNRHKEAMKQKENDAEPQPEEQRLSDQKEILLKWVEAGRPQTGGSEQQLWEELAKHLKKCMDDFFQQEKANKDDH